MCFYILKQLFGKLFGVVKGELRQKEGEIEGSQFNYIFDGGIGLNDLIELVDFGLKGRMETDEVQQVRIFGVAGLMYGVKYQGY